MNNVRKLTNLSMLLGIAIVLNIIEASLPIIPVPGAKVGFANLVTVIILYMYGFKEALSTNILRVILVGFLSPKGFDFTFYMALVGGISSVCVMAAAKRWFNLHIITVSVLGALIHNLGQVFVLIIALETIHLIYYYPIMLIIGIPAGMLVGVISSRFLKVFNVHKAAKTIKPVLVVPSINHKEEVLKYIEESKAIGEKYINGSGGIDRSPSYEVWLENKENLVKELGYAPSKTYFLVNESELVGMIDCRLSLTENLKKEGGHIGYSIRPKYRTKGYGKDQLRQAIELYKNWGGYHELLLTCSPDNIYSQKVIKSVGGVYQQTIKVNDKEVMHFIIRIDKDKE